MFAALLHGQQIRDGFFVIVVRAVIAARVVVGPRQQADKTVVPLRFRYGEYGFDDFAVFVLFMPWI
jgi:hypothetical protein